MDRRELLGGAVLGGLSNALSGTTVAAEPAAGAAMQSRDDMAPVVRAIDALRQELARQRLFTEIANIRDIQIRYLIANGKFPDFLEVGTDVWFQVHDWHVRWNQPLSVGRDLQNRPTIIFMATTIVMRPEQKDFVGIPYDNK